MADNALSPTQAFDNFANSAGMQFAQQQSANALNNLYAAHGSLNSGAAMKAISDRAQQIGLQNYFFPYLGYLQGQQGVGAQAGAAVAGVGSSFGNTAANINAGMGNTIQNGANALSNATIANGYANAGLGSAIGTGLGQLASSFVQPSSYSGGRVPYAYIPPFGS